MASLFQTAKFDLEIVNEHYSDPDPHIKCNCDKNGGTKNFMQQLWFLIHTLQIGKWSACEAEYATNKLTDALSGGLCLQCALFSVANIERFLSAKYIVSNPIMFKWDLRLVQTFRVAYFSHLKFYPSIRKFMFVQSNLWIPFIMIYIQSMWEIVKLPVSNRSVSEEKHLQNCFVTTTSFGAELISNLHLFGESQWKVLFKLGTNDDSCHFMVILEFIESQLRLETECCLRLDSQEKCDEVSHQVVATESLLKLVTFGWYYLKNNKDKLSNDYYSIASFYEWIDNIGMDHDFSRALITFRNEMYLNGYHHDVTNRLRFKWKREWNDMKCANVGCNVKRKDNDKLYKCKKCRVVRYCSKKCQKVDWNKNNHWEVCRQFRNKRKDKMSFWKRFL